MIDWGTGIWVAATVLATIIGGLFSWWSSQNVQNKRWQREDNKRYENERRFIYVRLLRIANQLSLLRTFGEAIPSDLEVEFMNVLSEIELLASPDTREHALAFGRAISDQFFNPGEKQLSEDAWDIRRKRFIDSIHKELGINVIRPRVPAPSFASSKALSRDRTEAKGDLSTQSQLPLPVVTGGIGLLLAYALPGGLTGGQGFLIGFGVGLLILGYGALKLNQRVAK